MPPDATPNYITREGAKRLQEELSDLLWKLRPKVVQDVADAAAHGDRSENAEYIYGKKKLREMDRRIHWLTRRLEKATVVEPRTTGDVGIVFFGAIVELEDENGTRACYRIVGEDEIYESRGPEVAPLAGRQPEGRTIRVSWRSPIGRVLLKRRAGDTVLLRRPSGEVELTILSVRYS